ncbi:alpha/beta fold hydrolase [Filobacillus milosensis]|uniref:Alpha/beta fold hydrolase n=1 Tax=Filobacillus milosensis TaxID=94137 RepID=A0A4Y8IL84_9BACI|nr:alpha/beta fold hydrolase [Filobacillus milosensis]TFB22035.1 alpha/beta fold hydrolase [Filobacillus milosensis]
MIVIDHTKVKHIPVLTVVDEEKINQPLPVLIYFHGFTSSKEQDLAQAYLLAEKGYRVLLPDSMHHGERMTTHDPNKIQFDFWKIVIQNIEDLQNIYLYLKENDLALDDRIGIAGTSMGGITVAAALTRFDWIKAAGIMMGSAKISEMAEYLLKGIEHQGIELPLSKEEIEQQMESLKTIDLSTQLERLNHRPIFIWHGESDQVVPYQHSTSFVDLLKTSQYPEELYQFISEPNRDHKVSREAKYALRDWLLTHL